MNANDIAETATITVDRFSPANARVRATITAHGGAAAIGYGPDEAAARADLAATVDFNLTHNGRAIA